MPRLVNSTATYLPHAKGIAGGSALLMSLMIFHARRVSRINRDVLDFFARSFLALRLLIVMRRMGHPHQDL